jgi:ribosomal protein S18 acetylase RimI-like enzyme
MINYTIRAARASEIHLLEDFIYEAIFQRDEKNLLPRNVINQPEIRVFIEGFGKPDDLCLLADIDGKIVGAVWTRILCGEVKGFGNIDNRTPEFAISLYKEYRNKGIGTALMKSMLQLLKECGYKQTSLAVQKDNYAVRMYKNVGFEIVRDLGEEYLMVHNLNLE